MEDALRMTVRLTDRLLNPPEFLALLMRATSQLEAWDRRLPILRRRAAFTRGPSTCYSATRLEPSGHRSQKAASDQLRLLAREVQASVRGEAQVLRIPIGAHETGGRVAVGEQQVAYLVGHRMREHNQGIDVVPFNLT